MNSTAQWLKCLTAHFQSIFMLWVQILSAFQFFHESSIDSYHTITIGHYRLSRQHAANQWFYPCAQIVIKHLRHHHKLAVAMTIDVGRHLFHSTIPTICVRAREGPHLLQPIRLHIILLLGLVKHVYQILTLLSTTIFTFIFDDIKDTHLEKTKRETKKLKYIAVIL